METARIPGGFRVRLTNVSDATLVVLDNITEEPQPDYATTHWYRTHPEQAVYSVVDEMLWPPREQGSYIASHHSAPFLNPRAAIVLPPTVTVERNISVRANLTNIFPHAEPGALDAVESSISDVLVPVFVFKEGLLRHVQTLRIPMGGTRKGTPRRGGGL